MTKKFYCLFLFLLLTFSAFGEDFTSEFKLTVPDENTFLSHLQNVIIAAGEVTYANITVEIPYSLYLNGTLMPSYNFFDNAKTAATSAFVWDSSNFLKNQYAHPYFGYLYFASGRSNNLTFIESALLTFGGSYMWETLFEPAPGSKNDLISTTTCGVMVGEALHRLYFPVYDFFKPLSFLVSPVDSLTAFIRGKNAEAPYGYISSTEIFAGSGCSLKPDFNTYAGFNLIYNDFYGHKTIQLFDQFYLSLEGNWNSTNPDFEFYERGFIYSIPVFLSRTESTFGIASSYDVLYSRDYHCAMENAGFLFAQKIPFGHDEDALNNLSWDLELSFIYLGITENYNYGTSAKLNLSYENSFAGKIGCGAECAYLRMYPSNTFETDNDSDLINRAYFFYEHKIAGKFYAGLKYTYFNKLDFSDASLINSTADHKFTVYGKFIFIN